MGIGKKTGSEEPFQKYYDSIKKPHFIEPQVKPVEKLKHFHCGGNKFKVGQGFIEPVVKNGNLNYIWHIDSTDNIVKPTFSVNGNNNYEFYRFTNNEFLSTALNVPYTDRATWKEGAETFVPSNEEYAIPVYNGYEIGDLSLDNNEQYHFKIITWNVKQKEEVNSRGMYVDNTVEAIHVDNTCTTVSGIVNLTINLQKTSIDNFFNR